MKTSITSAASYLYEEPGPKGRRNIAIGTAISVLAIAAIVAAALWQFGSNGQLDAARWTPFLDPAIWSYLLVGLLGTLQAAAVVAVLSGMLGMLLALARAGSIKRLSWAAAAYIEIARTVPVLLLIYLMLFGLPQLGLNFPTLWKLVIPLTLANSAVFAEIMRAGILSLPRGQAEAALSLGLKPHQVSRLVVLPQALRSVTPSLISQLVSLMKDTSLGYIVAFTELLYRAQVLSTYNHLLIQTFLVVTLIYLVFNGSLSTVAARFRRQGKIADPELPLPIPAVHATR